MAISRRWLDWIWGIGVVVSLIFVTRTFQVNVLCAQMGTDFRGYYAIVQTVWERGFAEGYDLQLQHELQVKLVHDCPGGAVQEPIPVAVPYLPAFVLLFLPLPLLKFSASYLAWSVLNLAALALYLLRFVRAFGGQVRGLRLIQFVICLPVIVNLFLGQVNVFLVICLGEFALAWQRSQPVRSGLWLALLLIKPQILILLLPGLLISQCWTILLSFLVGFVLVAGLSVLLAGSTGLVGSGAIVGQFASPAFSTAPTMMNWRSLANNLQAVLPAWIAWGIALAGMVLTIGFVVSVWRRQWKQNPASSPESMSYWMIAMYTATCAVTWHSHFYLWMPVLPFLLLLEARRKLPMPVLSLWVFGPPCLFLVAYISSPDIVRNLFGLGMLGFNLILCGWAGQKAIQLSVLSRCRL
jgi:hypothetical protein